MFEEIKPGYWYSESLGILRAGNTCIAEISSGQGFIRKSVLNSRDIKDVRRILKSLGIKPIN